jgi:site-specific recombinase XerD
MKIILSKKGIEGLLFSFRKHLVEVNGVAERTGESRVFYVREFLVYQARRWARRKRPVTFTARIWLSYVLRRSRCDSPGRLQSMGTALRSFCRFLCARGYTSHDWAPSIPRIGGARPCPCLDYLSHRQVQRVLRSFDRRTPAGRRNYAIVLCLVRLGLRAGEVAGLTLEQVDWRAGRMRIGAGKGRRERELPLPQDVGQALVQHLRGLDRRPDEQTLFGGISSTAISRMAQRALRRAAITTPRPGAHVFRRTMASHLVQHGATLKAVADLLGHRQLETTRLYAGVDHSMLREVARPWPKEVRR